MAFDVRRTQPKLNRRETWVQHLAEGNSIFESSQLDKRRSTKLEAASSNPSRTNTQGLKTTSEKSAALSL